MLSAQVVFEKRIVFIVFIYIMNFRNLDLNLLRVLDALITEGSTVAAGEKIGLSQPAVSAALGRLRRALDDPLFVRSRSGLEPTDYAASIAEPVAVALENLENALEPARFDPASAKMDFTIVSNDFFASLLMPRLSQSISTDAPYVRVQMIEGHPENYSAPVSAGDAAVMLGPDFLTPDHLETEFLFNMQSVIVARGDNRRLRAAEIGPDDDIPLDLFCDLPQVLYSTQGGFLGVVDQILATMGRSRNVAMSVNTFSGVMHTVDGSDLIGVIPMQLARDQAVRLGLECYELPIKMSPLRLSMAWHPRTSNTPSHLWLRTKIKESLADFRKA